ncbi:uncharacterized protein MEPE_06419 [Melanopsichium pennsylvanicum]|uniref:ER transporter 6TM N-terminal domain-containing protein n=1 Tax=Melanopsichium pennsylvanicum TaxID=63383 RepID=A0AAJ4XSC8_9BASI|nr:uncharacterized protein MEPE_06419 [Melanopsichium pennsylvanicum]
MIDSTSSHPGLSHARVASNDSQPQSRFNDTARHTNLHDSSTIPAISVTRMASASKLPTSAHALLESTSAASAEATRYESSVMHSSTLSSNQHQTTRNRARTRISAKTPSPNSEANAADIDQAEKQHLPSTTHNDTNNGKRKPKSSRVNAHWKRFAATIGLYPLPWYLSWILPCFTWPKLKPVIRSSLLAWICMLFILIRPTEIALGSASFLVLVAAFIQPAEAPLAAVVEREFFTLVFVCGAWLWSVIAIAISHAARKNKLSRAEFSIQRAVRGDYIEARSTIPCAVFLSVGSAVMLYVKVRFGPGPFLFASVLSCILLNIALTYAPLYPFPFYSLGQAVVVPLALKAAVNIFLSIVFFPKSVNSQFVEHLVAVLNPISEACGDQVKLLLTSPLDTPSSDPSSDKHPEVESAEQHKHGFDFEFVKNKLAAAEGGLVPVSMSSRLLTREISFGLANGDDLRALERLSRSLIAPADGWSYYYASIKADIQSAHFPKTPVPSRLATPAITPAITPRTSFEHSRDHSESGHTTQRDATHPTFTQKDSHQHQLHPPSRPHSPALTPLTPFATAHHDSPHMPVPASGTSTPHRESPLHSQVFPHESSHSTDATSFRQLDEHPSVQPGNELTSSRFRKMAHSIAAASRSSSPRRWTHHGHHGSTDVRDHHHHDSRYHQALDRSNQLLHNFVHKRDPAPVAIWESIRFGNLESYLHTPASNFITEMFAQLLRETCSDLLTADAEAIRHVVAWLSHLNSQRYRFLHDRLFLSKEQRADKGRKQADETAKVIASVEAKLSEFNRSQRLKVLDPYRDALCANQKASLGNADLAAELDLRTGPGEIGKIHHRYLYQAWLHQFHTISFTERLLALLREVEAIQRERTAAHLWFPHWPKMLSVDAWRNSSGDAHEADEPDNDPEHIPDITSDTPAASRTSSRGSAGAVESNSSSQTQRGHAQDEKGNGHAHAHFCSSSDHPQHHHQHHDDNLIGAERDPIVDLSSTRARDPDALDPEGFLQVVGHTIYFWTRRPFRGNTLFGVKAAALIALVSLPAHLKSSAGWCYENRAIWAIFMAQLTLARFRGETAFALLSRILATAIGAVFALIIWYISTGDGRGNAFGLGATTAVAFPIVMLFRIYFPGPPITPIIASVTTGLIVGYSWKDVTNPTIGSPGYGWTTAWKRLVAVVVGVSAAYIFSYLPPTSTLRQYQRLSHAATIAELGKIYCAVVGIASHSHQRATACSCCTTTTGVEKAVQSQLQSRSGSRRPSLHHPSESQQPSPALAGQLNNAKNEKEEEEEEKGKKATLVNVHPSSEAVRKRIIAIRAKLRRLSMISVNVSYEFSLRGRWPAARYRELFDVQMQISKLLSHCLAILERLGPAYSIALLRRTRFLDPKFLGDVVSVISMCSTALKTGEALPQVTPCPLVDRFLQTPHGFSAYLPTEDKYKNNMNGNGWNELDEMLSTLPQKITLTTLQDAEYMTFSVGVATLFGLVVRIDKLCIAVKELVGESYALPVQVYAMLNDNNHVQNLH